MKCAINMRFCLIFHRFPAGIAFLLTPAALLLFRNVPHLASTGLTQKGKYGEIDHCNHQTVQA